MNFKRPYIIETKNYIQVSYGGGVSPYLKDIKRNSITVFSRSSQKRLTEKIDCAIKYKPTLILKATFGYEIKIRDSNLIIIRYFEQMYKYFETVVKHIPLVFWRKNFDESGNFWLTFMLDFPMTFNIKKFIFVANLFWKNRLGKAGNIKVIQAGTNLDKEAVKSFCYSNCFVPEESVGRWWGMCYAKYRKFRKPKRIYCSTREIREIIKNMEKLKTEKIKNGIYEKTEKTQKKNFSIF